VTISTNMAGRGRISDWAARQPVPRRGRSVGGLYVIGTNRHESRRIDDQLRAGPDARAIRVRRGSSSASRTSCFFASALMSPSLPGEITARAMRLWTISSHPRDRPCAARGRRPEPGDPQDLYRYSCVVEHQRMVLHTRRQDLLTGRHRRSCWKSVQRNVTDGCCRRSQGSSGSGRATNHPVPHGPVLASISITSLSSGWPSLDEHRRQQPIDEFHITVGRAFCRLIETINDAVVQTFQSAEIPRGDRYGEGGSQRPLLHLDLLDQTTILRQLVRAILQNCANSGDLFRVLKRALRTSLLPGSRAKASRPP